VSSWRPLTSSGNVNYLHGDHLATTVNTTGSQTSGPQRYYPYGGQRNSASLATPYRYTGQREEANIGLYYYKRYPKRTTGIPTA